jgi:hypothetical protein
MEEIDFGRKNPMVWIVIFVVVYGLIFGGMVYLGVRDVLWRGVTSIGVAIEAVSICLMYLAGFVAFLFYALVSHYRFQFTDEGMNVLTWRGRQFFRWRDVQRVNLSIVEGGADLALDFGGLREVNIPIFNYRKTRTLVNEIARRIPVPIGLMDTPFGAAVQDD